MYICTKKSNGDLLFVDEAWGKLRFVDSIDKAFKYKSTLEFKVSVKMFGLPEDFKTANFYTVSSKTLELKRFNVDEIELQLKNNLVFTNDVFSLLKECGITSSHWLYDKDDNWIAFPEKDDLERVEKIKYLHRGLTTIIRDETTWKDRYYNSIVHNQFKKNQKKLMHNPTIQQLKLLDVDSCKVWYIHKMKTEQYSF